MNNDWRINISLFILALIIAFSAAHIAAKKQPTAHEVVGKYEQDGKCYIAVEVEVSPEEYIGYDIGDKYNAVFNAQ